MFLDFVKNLGLSEFIGHIKNVFVTVQFKDYIDILLLAYLIYNVLRFIKQTRAMHLLRGLILLFAVIVLAQWLNLSAIGYLMTNVLQLSLLMIFIVFQPELRSLLEKLGRVRIMNVFPFSKGHGFEQDRIGAGVESICECCAELSSLRIGGLIVLEKSTRLGDVELTGTLLNCNLTAQMLVTIFYPKTPLHDGAVIIRDFEIVAAGCLLPLSQRLEISKSLGTRHRAAVGMSEISDALIIVVSEETGKISFAQNGDIHTDVSVDRLRKILIESFGTEKRQGKAEVSV